MAIKGLIFDLDGVITDTAKLHFEAWRDILAKEKIKYTEKENELLKGLPRKETLLAILKLKKIKLDNKKIDKMCEDKNNLYIKSLKTKITKKDILPGIKKLLDDAKKAKIKMAIASSSKNAKTILERLDVIDYFDYIVNVDKIKNGKPAPDIYLAAAQGLKLKPEECVGFEDALVGIQGLMSAKIHAVSVTYGIKEMYVNGTFICDTTADINLDKILAYFNSSEKFSYESVYHTAYGRYAYQNSTGDTLSTIIRVKKDNVDHIKVRFGDPFNWRKKDGPDVGVTQFGGDETMYWEEDGTVKMDKYLSDEFFDYYKAKFATKTKRVRYAFEIHAKDGSSTLYGERGFFPISECIAGMGFTWGYLHEGNVTNIPRWVSKMVWYQIFPERFWNGDKSNDNKGTLAWGSAEPTPENYFGGDLQGVIDKLDHLVDLGVTGIYFTPIFKANTNHKYDTEDYLQIDPHFGDEKKFKELIDKCHKKGIKIMIDAVFNHSGSKFAPWLDVVKNKEKSKYKDWFFVNNFKALKPSDEYGPNYFLNKEYVYETFAFTPHMPRLNWSNPGVIEYFKKVVEKWTSLGIDAWRLDVANEPTLNFWRMFRKWAKDINPDIYILGEVWYNSSLYLNGDTFDGVMNYTLRDCVMNLVKNEWSKTKIEEEMSKYLLIYNNPIKRGMFNLLGSHDTPRIMTFFEHNLDKFKLAYKLLFHMLGSVCIYYGDEIGMDGDHDPGCRKCMIWDKKKWNMDTLNMFKTLIKMRKKYEALTNGEFQFINDSNKKELYKSKMNDEVVAFKIYRKKEVIYCLVNASSKKHKVELANKKWFDIYNEKSIKPSLEIKPFEMVSIIVK